MSSWHILAIALILIVFDSILFDFIMNTINRKKQKNNAGIIVINTTDPEKDVIRIELSVSVGELMAMKEVNFQIKNEDS